MDSAFVASHGDYATAWRKRDIRQTTCDLSFDERADEKGFTGKTPDDLLYGDMSGLIPSDKLEAAKQYTLMRIERAKGRGLDEEVRRWTKVRDNLTDRITTPEGVEGRPATNEEMRRKAIDVSSRKKLDPADDGMTTSQLIAASDIVKQSLKAGGTAAALSAALRSRVRVKALCAALRFVKLFGYFIELCLKLFLL